MNEPVTQWFEADHEPVHAGVYEVKSHHFGVLKTWFSYWNGFHFCYRDGSPEAAYINRMVKTVAPWKIEWRGLASQPDTEKE